VSDVAVDLFFDEDEEVVLIISEPNATKQKRAPYKG